MSLWATRMRGLLGVWHWKLSPARLKTSRGRKGRAFWSAYNQHLLASWSSVCYIVTYRVGKLFFKANQESHLINKKEYFRVLNLKNEISTLLRVRAPLLTFAKPKLTLYMFHSRYLLFKWVNNFFATAKELIRGLLRTDPQNRFTVEQVMNNPWIKVC